MRLRFAAIAMLAQLAVFGQITTGTIFLDPDIITPADPTTYTGITANGTGNRLMFDRRVDAFVTLNAFLFNASYSDGPNVEVQVNPEFGTVAAAQVEAAKYARVIGQLPVILRSKLDTVWIHMGVQPFGGGNRNLLIHIGQADQYVAAGILEETLVHEASHTSLDGDHAASSGWLAAQASDPAFISTYARDNRTREDIAETFLTWLMVRYRGDRITNALAQQIETTVPARLAYFDRQAFNILPVTNISSGPPVPLGFLPVSPCRVADTRNATGPLGGPAIAALATRNFPVRSACGLPATATAYSLNITVVPRGSLGYLSIWPGGRTQPTVSTLNALDGRIKANAAIVPAGADGSVNVFVTDTTDVIIDINGVFVPQAANASSQSFYPVNPCRISDTRVSGGTMQALVDRTITVATLCGIPVTATAYALNFTVVPKQTLGFLTLWPNNGSGRPTVSTLNALTGTVTANLAIVPAGNAGDILAFATDATELIVDVTGYFGPSGFPGGLRFYSLDPCRILDTRLADGPLGGPMPQAGSTRAFPVSSSACGVPPTAQAYSLNATVLPSPVLGFLTLFPTGAARPLASTLNAVDGSLTSNAAIVPSGITGQISAYVTERTHLILDLNGYFAP
jgi:hypothetical protein